MTADAKRLVALDAALRTAPDRAELHFERARALAKLGRGEDAIDAYRRTLRLDGSHFGALTDLAIALYNAGVRTTAFELFERAIRHHPRNAVAQTNFAFVLVKSGQLERAQEHYETALAIDPKNAEARRGLAAVATQRGKQPAAATSADDAVVTLPYRGAGAGTPLLLLCSLGAGNVATGPLLDQATFAVTKLIVELFPSGATLPPHRLVFNAVGDADACGAALAAAAKLVATSSVPVVNAPERVLSTRRVEIARRLRAIDGVVTAHTELFPRTLLAEANAPEVLAERGFWFPLLVRSPGFHTGDHFELAQAPEDLPAALASLPGEDLYVLQFVDTRAADGTFRKYRAIFVDRRPYPLHLAIGRQWKVHYHSADMAESAAHRAQDEAFLADMDGALGEGVIGTLGRIAATLDLDYAGIDFAVDASGCVVVFEANATMIVPTPPADPRWDYRRPAVTRIREAVRAMLLDKVDRLCPSG